MTVGKDVSTLFMDVVNCIQTGKRQIFKTNLMLQCLICNNINIDNLELKKLVYLYLINYAKTQPDQAILAVNTFVKDANDPVSTSPINIFFFSDVMYFILESFDKSISYTNYGLYSC